MRSIGSAYLLIGLMALASKTQAQSSVTLYGTLDEAAVYFNNTGHGSVVQMQGGDLDANRWGLKGQEDLGGGLKAIFTLENGFEVNTGQTGQDGREFGMQAFVGLSSETLGTLTLGRQYDPIVDLLQPITADGYGAAFSTPGDADNNDNTFWVNNSVKYASPTYAGFQYELMYALGGVAGNTSAGQTYSASALYAIDGFSVAAGYLYAKNNQAGGGGTSDQNQNNSVTPLFGETAFIGSRQMVQAAMQYVIGTLTANVRYSNVQYKPFADFGAFNRTENFNIGAASLGWQIKPDVLLAVGYTFTKSSGASSATYNSVAATSQLNLSKRTVLYATGGYTHASGTTFSSDGATLVAAGGTISDMTSSSSTPNQVALMVGILHRF